MSYIMSFAALLIVLTVGALVFYDVAGGLRWHNLSWKKKLFGWGLGLPQILLSNELVVSVKLFPKETV